MGEKENLTGPGLSPDELFDEVTQIILPQYASERLKLSKSEHFKHLRTILDALDAATPDQLESLINAIRAAMLLVAANAVGTRRMFRQPQEIYLTKRHVGSDMLERYFGRDPKIYFLDGAYDGFTKEELERLGCLTQVRPADRRPDRDEPTPPDCKAGQSGDNVV